LAWKYSVKRICYYKVLTLDNIDEINKILQLTQKGMFIERRIAIPAWRPILSLESEDNEQWKEIKTNFLNFVNKHRVINSLEKCFEECSDRALSRYDVIDSEQISKITVCTFCYFLFDYHLKDDEINLLYVASLEWRKEIAMKAQGSMVIKIKAIETILNIIKLN